MTVLDPRPGDAWLLVRPRPGADPASEVARLRRLIKQLGRRFGFDVWWVDLELYLKEREEDRHGR